MLKSIFMSVSGLFFLVMMASLVYASAVDLAWDPPEDGGEPTGYIVYASTTKGDYSNPVAVEIVEAAYATISGLDNTLTYYFIVKAYNCAGTGDASDEVSIEGYSDTFYDDVEDTDDTDSGSSDTEDSGSTETEDSGDVGAKGSGGCFVATAAH